MAIKLTDVVTWKGRTEPGHRVIPRHLKLGILSRGRATLPSKNVLWLLDMARTNGVTWVDRLDKPFEDIVDQVSVTLELFWQRPAAMLDSDVDATLAPYLGLRHRRHLSHCWYILYGFVRHPDRRKLADALGVDIARLFAKPRVYPLTREAHRYIVLAYVCIPSSVLRHIRPEHGEPSPPPAPSSGMPALEGLIASNVERHLRTGPTTSAPSLGETDGDVQWLDVLAKARGDNLVWLHVRLRTAMRVTVAGADKVLPAGTEAWIERQGVDPVVAPWHVFRGHFAAWEGQHSSLPLGERITKLRQLTHTRKWPFDAVIGAKPGTEYLEDRTVDDTQWQIGIDYMAFRAPDGQPIDIHHLCVGLDAKQHPEHLATVSLVDVGTSWAASTWSGDIGAGIADMEYKADRNFERRDPRASRAVRTQHYYESRAGDWDLLPDIDVWQIDAIRRAGTYSKIDLIVASYYERTVNGQVRMLTRDRGLAIAAFLRHYGFAYDVNVDYANFPVLPKQSGGVRRVITELDMFARIWILQKDPWLVQVDDPSAKSPDPTTLSDMAGLFLSWLEHAAIENGVQT